MMMQMLLIYSACFLLGSFPTAYILVKIRRHQDIRRLGSGNVGTMNVKAQMGWGTALLVGTVDFLKGAAAVYLCSLLSVDVFLGLAAAVLGHIYPPWLRFRGGKGIATILGGLVCSLQIKSLAVFFIVWLLFAPNRNVDRANLAGSLAAVWFAIAAGPCWTLALVWTIVAVRHIQVLHES